MPLTQFVENDTLLTYSLLTSPSPVEASPLKGPPSVASLTFVVSAPVSAGTVTVTQITFSLPIGDPKNPDATDLTETAAGISPAVGTTGTGTWQIGPGAAPGTFVLKPTSGGGIVDSQGLTVRLTGIQVSQLVGTALVNVIEDATNSGAPEPRISSVEVAKFPFGFYAGNFTASEPMVANGDAVTLSWIGSVDATYTIVWGKQSQNVSTVNQWKSPTLTDTTAFILEVSAQQSGQTVRLYFSTTVIVAEPDITATSLKVLATTGLAGDVTIGSSSVSSSLNVSGAASAGSVKAGALEIIGEATLATLSASGAANVGSLKTPSLDATQATLGAATVSSLNALGGKVSMIGAPQKITPGSWSAPASFVAPTDGFAIGVIGYPSSSSPGCMCYGYGQTNGMTVFTTGGNVGFFGPGWSDYMSMNPNSFLLPISAGSTFYVAVAQATGGQQADAPYWYYWVSVGDGSVAAALEEQAEPGADFMPPPPPTEQHTDQSSDLEFIAILERLLGETIDDVTKQQLLECLHRL